ncbi:hypothetical protein M5689_024798 [Euphorbia peplus]|nr:hypothetical protein M5689_024798 [Euphorbia peplus]
MLLESFGVISFLLSSRRLTKSGYRQVGNVISSENEVGKTLKIYDSAFGMVKVLREHDFSFGHNDGNEGSIQEFGYIPFQVTDQHER